MNIQISACIFTNRSSVSYKIITVYYLFHLSLEYVCSGVVTHWMSKLFVINIMCICRLRPPMHREVSIVVITGLKSVDSGLLAVTPPSAKYKRQLYSKSLVLCKHLKSLNVAQKIQKLPRTSFGSENNLKGIKYKLALHEAGKHQKLKLRCINCINIAIYKSNTKTRHSFLKIYKMQRNNLHVHRTPAQDHFTDTYGFTIFTFKLQTIFHRCIQTQIK